MDPNGPNVNYACWRSTCWHSEFILFSSGFGAFGFWCRVGSSTSDANLNRFVQDFAASWARGGSEMSREQEKQHKEWYAYSSTYIVQLTSISTIGNVARKNAAKKKNPLLAVPSLRFNTDHNPPPPSPPPPLTHRPTDMHQHLHMRLQLVVSHPIRRGRALSAVLEAIQARRRTSTPLLDVHAVLSHPVRARTRAYLLDLPTPAPGFWQVNVPKARTTQEPRLLRGRKVLITVLWVLDQQAGYTLPPQQASSVRGAHTRLHP